VTAVSESLKQDTYRELGHTRDIRVIPNFVDIADTTRRDCGDLKATFAPNGEKLVIHVSNFRPVKRVGAVVEVFRQIHATVPSRLLMVGDGPDLPEAAAQVRAAGLADHVRFLGDQEQVVQLLSASDLFLMPSAQESFGLAALEAMACEVPVVASRVGGVPELVDDGVTGILCPAEDLPAMAAASIRLLTDAALHARMAKAARSTAVKRFADSRIVPMYERFYDEVLAGGAT